MGQESSNTGKCNNTTTRPTRNYIYYNINCGIEYNDNDHDNDKNNNDNRLIIHNKNGAHSVNPSKVISYALNHVNPRHRDLVFGYMKQFRSSMNNFYPKTPIVKVFGFMCINQYETLSVLSNHNRQCFHNIRLLILLYFHERETVIHNNSDEREVDIDITTSISREEESDNRNEAKVVEDLYDEIYDDLLAVVMAVSRSPSPMPPSSNHNPVSPIQDPSNMGNSTSRETSLATPKYGLSDSNNHLISPRTKLLEKYEAQKAMKIDNETGYALRNDEWWVSPEYSPEFPDPQEIEFQQS